MLGRFQWQTTCIMGMSSRSGFGIRQVLSVNSHKGSTTFYTARAQGGRKVAVKALSLQNMAKWDELEAFERESRALRALTHARSANTAIPSFVEVFEEDDRDRTFYLVQVSLRCQHGLIALWVSGSHHCICHWSSRFQVSLQVSLLPIRCRSCPTLLLVVLIRVRIAVRPGSAVSCGEGIVTSHDLATD